jgi:hypothetical protein
MTTAFMPKRYADADVMYNQLSGTDNNGSRSCTAFSGIGMGKTCLQSKRAFEAALR